MDVLNINMSSQSGHQQLANTLSAFLQTRHQLTQNCSAELNGLAANLNTKLMEVSTGSSTSDEPTDLSPTNTNPGGTPTRSHFPGGDDILSDSGCDNFNRKTPNSSSGGLYTDLDPTMPNLLSPSQYEPQNNTSNPQQRITGSQQQRRKTNTSGAKSGTKKSFVWKYFRHPNTEEGSLDRSRTQCLLCESQLAFNASGTTTTMLNHLKSRHGDIAESEELTRRYHREMNLVHGGTPLGKKAQTTDNSTDGPQVKRRKNFVSKEIGSKLQNGFDDNSLFSIGTGTGNFPATAQQRAMLSEILANNNRSFHSFQSGKADILSSLGVDSRSVINEEHQDLNKNSFPITGTINPFQSTNSAFSNAFNLPLNSNGSLDQCTMSPFNLLGFGSPKSVGNNENRESRPDSPHNNCQQFLTNFLASMQTGKPSVPVNQSMFNPLLMQFLNGVQKKPDSLIKHNEETQDRMGSTNPFVSNGFPGSNILTPQNVLSTLTNLTNYLNVNARDSNAFLGPHSPTQKHKEESDRDIGFQGAFSSTNPMLTAQIQAYLSSGKIIPTMSQGFNMDKMLSNQTKPVSRRKRQPKQLVAQEIQTFQEKRPASTVDSPAVESIGSVDLVLEENRENSPIPIQDELLRSIAFFLIKDLKPVDLLAGIGFRNLLKLNPGIADPDEMRKNYLPLIQAEICQKILSHFQQNLSNFPYVSLLGELWKHKSGLEMISIGVKLGSQEFLWKTLPMPEENEIFVKLLNEVINELGIEPSTQPFFFITSNQPTRLNSIFKEHEIGSEKFFATPCLLGCFNKAIESSLQTNREFQTLYSMILDRMDSGDYFKKKSDANRRISQLSESSGTGSLESDQGLHPDQTDSINFEQALKLSRFTNFLNEAELNQFEQYRRLLFELKEIRDNLKNGVSFSSVSTVNKLLEEIINLDGPDDMKKQIFATFVKSIESFPILSEALSISKFLQLKEQQGNLDELDPDSFYVTFARELNRMQKSLQVTSEDLQKYFEGSHGLGNKISNTICSYKDKVLASIPSNCDLVNQRQLVFKSNRSELPLEDVSLYLFMNANWNMFVQ